MLKSHRYLLGLFWMLAIFIFPLPLIQALANGLTGPAISNLGIQLGTIAYAWMLLIIFISTKPKWLDRIIGLPSMYFLHGGLAIIMIVFAYVHKLMTSSNGLIKLTGDIGLWILIGTAVYSIFFLSGWLTDRIHWLKIWIRFFEKHIFKHEVSVWLHRLNILATLFVFIHVLLIDYIMQIKGFAILFYAYSLIVFALYAYFLISKTWRFNRAKVIDIRPLSANMTQVTLRFSHTRAEKLKKYQAGDYLFIDFPNIEGMKEMHPFSFVDFDYEKRQVVLAIRADGDFSHKIAKITIGESARIDGPFGTLNNQILNQDDKQQALILLAGGTGVVPLISLALAYASKREIYFIWTVSSEADLVYRKLLLQLADQWPNFYYFESIHRLNLEKISAILPETIIDQAYFLMSGSNKMMIGYRSLLAKFGVKAKNIYYEKFSF